MRRRLGAPRKSLLLSVNHSIEKCKTREVGIRHEKEIWRVARRGYLIARDLFIQPRAYLTLNICTPSSDTASASLNIIADHSSVKIP